MMMAGRGTKTPGKGRVGGPLTMPQVQVDRAAEPVLDIDQIQGNIFPGFSKDHQTLLFLRIDEAAAFRRWLGRILPRIATTEFVLAFSRLFKGLVRQQGEERGTIRATWLNVAFSFAGLKKLETAGMNLDSFVDASFKKGLLNSSNAGRLGDPVGTGTVGDPKNWLIGGPGREADVVLIVADDRRDDLNDEIASLATTLFPHPDAKGSTVASGATLLLRLDGDTLLGSLAGHEQFGFLDGVSQPGVRGLLPDGTPLTPSQNPLDPGQGKPGQDLLWPGEFVFGYPGQDAKQDVSVPGTDPLLNPKRAAPKFARNGSFLVFRRLRQEVGKFHRFLGQLAAKFQLTPEFVGARIVGRWPSGAPVVVTPQHDDAPLGDDACRNNNFEYQAPDSPPAKPVHLPGDVCPNVQPPANDPSGAKAPFAAHIRKAYPRNDTSQTIPGLGENSTQTHRLLRRGIPYGAQSASTLTSPVDDGVDRGLLFLAYQVSLVDQFEFVTANWVNNPNFKENGAGFDPIIGQNSKDPNRRRLFLLSLPGETQPVETDQDWVIPTGGGYFFAPSIDALRMLANVAPATAPKRTRAGKKGGKGRKKAK
jgi:Dyp-type peroxidase family